MVTIGARLLRKVRDMESVCSKKQENVCSDKIDGWIFSSKHVVVKINEHHNEVLFFSVVFNIFLTLYTYQLVMSRHCNAGPESWGRYENNNNKTNNNSPYRHMANVKCR